MTYLLAGATGLVGSQLLAELLRETETTAVFAFSRKPQASSPDARLQWLTLPGESEAVPPAETLILALGTTMAKAGSKEAFWATDVALPLSLAQKAREAGCRRVLLVSAKGADPRSSIFYNRAKGALEAELAAMAWDSFGVVRPSLLLGARTESRPGERLAQIIFAPIRNWLPASIRPVTAFQVARALLSLRKNPGQKILENQEICRFPGT